MKKELKTLTNEQKKLIDEAIRWCDEMEKSTEFMIQYASDVSGVYCEEVVEYIIQNNYKCLNQQLRKN